MELKLSHNLLLHMVRKNRPNTKKVLITTKLLAQQYGNRMPVAEIIRQLRTRYLLSKNTSWQALNKAIAEYPTLFNQYKYKSKKYLAPTNDIKYGNSITDIPIYRPDTVLFVNPDETILEPQILRGLIGYNLLFGTKEKSISRAKIHELLNISEPTQRKLENILKIKVTDNYINLGKLDYSHVTLRGGFINQQGQLLLQMSNSFSFKNESFRKRKLRFKKGTVLHFEKAATKMRTSSAVTKSEWGTVPAKFMNCYSTNKYLHGLMSNDYLFMKMYHQKSFKTGDLFNDNYLLTRIKELE